MLSESTSEPYFSRTVHFFPKKKNAYIKNLGFFLGGGDKEHSLRIYVSFNFDKNSMTFIYELTYS